MGPNYSLHRLSAVQVVSILAVVNTFTNSELQTQTTCSIMQAVYTTTPALKLEAPLTSAGSPNPGLEDQLRKGALFSPATINDPCSHSDLGPARSSNAQYTSWTSCLAAVYESAYLSKFESTSARSLSTNDAKPVTTAAVWLAAPAIGVIGGILPLL